MVSICFSPKSGGIMAQNCWVTNTIVMIISLVGMTLLMMTMAIIVAMTFHLSHVLYWWWLCWWWWWWWRWYSTWSMPGPRTKTYTCVSREPCTQSLLIHILKITNKFLIDMFIFWCCHFHIIASNFSTLLYVWQFEECLPARVFVSLVASSSNLKQTNSIYTLA